MEQSKKKTSSISVATRAQAWAEVNKIFPAGYMKDMPASRRAGYPIYTSLLSPSCGRICDLNNRLEVLAGEYGETVTNIWIAEAAGESAAPGTTAAARIPGYGEAHAEEIRERYGSDFSKITHFEQFVLNRGWEFKTKESLMAAYDRAWKCSRGILITENEFVAEAGLRIDTFPQWNEEAARETYRTLAGLVRSGKLGAGEVYSYANYMWCLGKPEAIVAYQEGQDVWIVNNCGTEVSEDTAKVEVNSEWGFEVSRIEIIGTAYYRATDYQYIRFDCAHMTWLWKNGNLYQVYA